MTICQGCGKKWKEHQLAEITHGFWERVSPGEICPSGECPECGALCHPEVEKTTTRISLNEHQLQELLSGQIVKVEEVEIALQDIDQFLFLKAMYEASQSRLMMIFGPIYKPKDEGEHDGQQDSKSSGQGVIES